jgi:signal transduction histidine kinase
MTRKVYEHVNESIAQLLGAEMCAVLLYDQDEEALLCQSPMYGVSDDIAPRYRIPVVKESLVSEIWRVQSHLILNGVQQNPLIAALGLGDLAAEAGLRDTLLAKLTVANHDLGVIQASNRLDGAPFSEDDARLLCIFAAQAAAVIENARLYEELSTAKGLVGARTALAWMGMANNAWRHSIEGHAINIRNAVTLLGGEIEDDSHDLKRPAMQDKLALVDRLAQQILDKPITPPLSSEEGIEEINVNDLISERIDQLWENESYQAVTTRLRLGSDANLGVRVSPEWLRRALDLLVDNAVEAMVGSPSSELEISTRLVNSEVEIAIQDRGSGIPSNILPRLFKEQIKSDGLGMGLMMVQAILHTYGGDVHVGETGPYGTTMVVTLPVAQQDKTHSERDA